MSKQIPEALSIEEFGNLDKKSEFSNNHISRLEAGLSESEKTKLKDQELYARANYVSNITNFANVIHSVSNNNFISELS